MNALFHPILPATERRVLQSTAPEVNERNRRQIEEDVARYAGASPVEIDRRIRELEAEWDIERALETGAALNAGFGLAMGAFVDRRWFAWSGVVLAFLLQHALQGWCPPLPIMRRLGVRTAAEIEEEKTALRLLRGDFHETRDPSEALAQVRNATLPTASNPSTKGDSLNESPPHESLVALSGRRRHRRVELGGLCHRQQAHRHHHGL